MSSQKNRGPVDDEQRGLELGEALELSVHGERAAAVVVGGCWLLAAVIVQAIEDNDSDPLEAIATVTQQLATCVAHLQYSRSQARH